MIEARFQLDEYTSRVLDTVKGRFGLKNRNEALRKMAQDVGGEYLVPIPNERVLEEIDAIFKDHLAKNPNRKMTDRELKQLLNL